VINHPGISAGCLFSTQRTNILTVGDLPEYLQGSNALLAAGENGGLIEMPVTPSDFNAWNRETNVSLDGDGGIKGVIRERTTGQEARLAENDVSLAAHR
jgi:hypothetical protein